MSVLFGHPGGNPNSHHAALAHWETGRLSAFVTPWFPSRLELALLRSIPGLQRGVDRLQRRRFEPLAKAPKVQGRFGEWRRLWHHWRGEGDEGLSYEANDWLMKTMARRCRSSEVTAVHAYEDCSLWQFEEAKRLGKACIYDMPIGYYPYWEQTESDLAIKYSHWLPSGGLPSKQWVRPGQKRLEMELADLVLAPSTFVQRTIQRFHPEKKICLVPYGVDLEYWHPPSIPAPPSEELRFLYVGQLSIRKGITLLLEAWEKSALPGAKLVVVGSWQLDEGCRRKLPRGVEYHPPCSASELRRHYQEANVLLFPSFFDGFGLAILEALACGKPVVATEASAGPDILDDASGKIISSGSMEELIEAMRWFVENRDKIPSMKTSARARAERCKWTAYRARVSEAVAPFV